MDVIILVGLVALIFYLIFIYATKNYHKDEDTIHVPEHIQSNMEELAQVIYDEICNYCKRNNLTIDSIKGIFTGTYSTHILYNNSIDQEIEYKPLGYQVSLADEKISGQKELGLQIALVKLIGEDRWAVVISQSVCSYEDKSKTVIRRGDYGAIIASHPTEYYDQIDSRIVSRELIEVYCRTGYQEYEKLQQEKNHPQKPIKTL